MNFADFTLISLLLFAFLSSCYLLTIFLLDWRRGKHTGALAPSLDLPWKDFIIFTTGFLFCFWKARDCLIIYALLGILILLVIRSLSPVSFWNPGNRSFPDYLKSGLLAYFTLFLPFWLLTAACTWVFTSLGFKEINQPAVEMLMRSEGLPSTLYFLILACVVAPLWEEITFRGFLYPFLKAKTGIKSAVIVSSLLFAALHQHLPSFIPLTFFGIILALLYEKKGSLADCIILHSVFNLFTCIVLLLLKHGSNPHLWKSL